MLNWEQLGADLWRVADAVGIERAVLYGVGDACYTVAQAAALNPERVLGVILNLVPPGSISNQESPAEVTEEQSAAWTARNGAGLGLSQLGDVADDPRRLLEAFGVDEGEARALAERWQSSSSAEAAQRRRDLILSADMGALLPSITAPALVLQPTRRPAFQRSAEATARRLPMARLVQPSRGIEALGAIHAFLALLTSDVGREASRLSPQLSATVDSSEESLRHLRRIAVVVDDDVASGSAVELACRLGAAQQAEIILIHVIEVPYALALDEPSGDAVARAERAIEVGEAIVKRHRLGLRASHIVHGRNVAGSVIRTADEDDAQLIVVSNSSAGQDGSGSNPTVSQLLRRAPGKVLVSARNGA